MIRRNGAEQTRGCLLFFFFFLRCIKGILPGNCTIVGVLVTLLPMFQVSLFSCVNEINIHCYSRPHAAVCIFRLRQQIFAPVSPAPLQNCSQVAPEHLISLPLFPDFCIPMFCTISMLAWTPWIFGGAQKGLVVLKELSDEEWRENLFDLSCGSQISKCVAHTRTECPHNPTNIGISHAV